MDGGQFLIIDESAQGTRRDQRSIAFLRLSMAA
jgi:hypothetical protein